MLAAGQLRAVVHPCPLSLPAAAGRSIGKAVPLKRYTCRIRRSHSRFLYAVRRNCCLPRFWVLRQARFRKHFRVRLPTVKLVQ
jgi:hypothetical protein